MSAQAANIERAGFAVLGVVIKAIEHAGAAVGANGLNVTLDAQLVADIKSIAPAVKGALCRYWWRSRARCRTYGVNGTSTRYPLTSKLKITGPLLALPRPEILTSEYKRTCCPHVVLFPGWIRLGIAGGDVSGT